MASNKLETETKIEGKLKHLGTVRMMAINVVVIVSDLYDYAKENSGPLKSTVGTVENAVTTVVKPVYERFKGFPDELLVFLDSKVDEATEKFDEHAPPLAKKVVNKAQCAVQKASQVAKDLMQVAQVGGPRAAVSHAGILTKNFAVSQIAVFWYKMNHFPPLHGLTEMTVPTAAHWSDKYNESVIKMTARGYTLFGFLPLVPIEQIAKAYKQVEAGESKKDEAASSSSSEAETD